MCTVACRQQYTWSKIFTSTVHKSSQDWKWTNKKITTMILKKVTSSNFTIFLQINNFLALELSSFDNTDDKTINVGFWIIQKVTSGISVETVKIRDNPI